LERIAGTLHEDQYTFLLHRAQFYLELKMLQTKVVEEIKTHFLFSNFFFKSCRLWENTKKKNRYSRI